MKALLAISVAAVCGAALVSSAACSSDESESTATTTTATTTTTTTSTNSGGAGGTGGGEVGGAGPCNAACTTGAQPDAACLACDQQVAGAACATPWTACMADGAGGSGGAGGAGGTGGAGGGQCYTCSELVLGNLPPTAACPGTSTELIGALVTCLCTECG